MEDTWVILHHIDFDFIEKDFLKNPYLFGPKELLIAIQPLEQYNAIPQHSPNWCVYKETNLLDASNHLQSYNKKWDDAIEQRIKTNKKILRKKDRPLSFRFEILKRDGYRCQFCGRSSASDGVVLEIDHKLPKSRGGTNHPSNLWVLCYECNQGKKANIL